MSENYKDVIRSFPQPKRIGGDFQVPLSMPGSPVIAGDKNNPIMVVNITMGLRPDFIRSVVMASIAMGTDKSAILRYLYELDDVVQKLIEEIESSDDVNVKRKVL